MIRLTDTLLLATTKLRTRRLRTTVTIIISGLLFAVLVASLTLYQGALNSITKFNKNGLGSRYIVGSLADSYLNSETLDSKTIQAQAQQLYDQAVTAKTAAAKKLNIPYDPSSEAKVSFPFGDNSGRSVLNLSSPYAQQALEQYLKTRPQPGMDTLKAISAPYHPSGFYTSTQTDIQSQLKTMQNGLEDFSVNSVGDYNQNKDIFTQRAPTFMDRQLTSPFLLKKTSWSPKSGAIPLVVPYKVAQNLLGLPTLPANATDSQKLQQIQTIYSKAGSVTVTACYRNAASSALIQTAISTTAAIVKNAGNKAYTKPNLIYTLPAANSCGPATVSSDTRSKQELLTLQNQAIFDAEFNETPEPPMQQKIVFQVVGVVPDAPSGPTNSAAGLLQGLVDSSLANTLAIPQDLYNELSTSSQYANVFADHTPSNGFGGGFSNTTNYVEFHTANEARTFINEKSCTTRSDGTCATSTKPFQLSAFGSNSIALQDLQHKFRTFFTYGAILFSVLAAVIMASTIGRTLADSRRETAVFRAIGASRMDIVVIYGLYTFCLSLMIAAVSLAFGLGIAKLLDIHYWRIATVEAKLAYGGISLTQTFHLFGYTMQIWLVFAAAVIAGLLGLVLPLLRNVRRNPIKDMREE